MEKSKLITAGISLIAAAAVFLFSVNVRPQNPLPFAARSITEANEPKEKISDTTSDAATGAEETLPEPSNIAPKVLAQPKSAPTAAPPRTDPSPAQAQPSPTVECDRSTFNTEFLCLINNYRASLGLGKLSYDSALNKVAYDYSVSMHESGNFSHTGTDGSKFYERCAAAGTTCYAENLAKGFSSAQQVFDLWKASPGHNKNMTGPYKQMGMGLYGTYATNLFR